MTIIKTYPYTFDQLRFFDKEIKEAGGVEKLMIKKEALRISNGLSIIVTCRDVEGYREKHLVGIYESLRTNYTTEVPYVFWSKLYEMLKRI
jgi:hypothetical protein